MYTLIVFSDYHGGEFGMVTTKKTMKECLEDSGISYFIEDVVADYLDFPKSYNCTEDVLFEKYIKSQCAFGDGIEEHGLARVLRKLDPITFEYSESPELYEEAYAEVKKLMHKRIKEMKKEANKNFENEPIV